MTPADEEFLNGLRVGDTYNIEDLPSTKSLFRMAKVANKGKTMYWVMKTMVTRDCIGIFEDCYPRGELNFSERLVNAISKQVGSNEWNWEPVSQAEFETYREFGIKEFKLPSEVEIPQ